MRERLRELGGRLEVESDANGTMIRAVIPISASSPAKKSEKTGQEFVLRWSKDGGSSFTDIVRQQWNFSPPGSIREAEEFHVELSGVTVLELIVKPNLSGGDACASLRNLRLS